jgi:hypothetical protein
MQCEVHERPAQTRAVTLKSMHACCLVGCLLHTVALKWCAACLNTIIPAVETGASSSSTYGTPWRCPDCFLRHTSLVPLNGPFAFGHAKTTTRTKELLRGLGFRVKTQALDPASNTLAAAAACRQARLG